MLIIRIESLDDEYGWHVERDGQLLVWGVADSQRQAIEKALSDLVGMNEID